MKWLLAIVLLGAGLRIARLGHQSMWYDEVMAIHQANLPVTKMHAPLYSLTLRGWIKMFGTGTIALRSLSVLAGIASLPLLYLIARRWTSELPALVATGLFAISPAHVFYSQEAEPFAFAVLLSLAGVLLLAQCRYGFAVAMLAAAALSFEWGRDGSSRSLVQLGITPLFLVAGRTFVWKDSATWMKAAGITVALLAILPALVQARNRTTWLWFGVALALPVAFAPYLAHYSLLALPAFLILLASRPRWCVLAFAVGAISLANYFLSTVKPEWNKAAAFVSAEPGDIALFDADFNQDSFAYYFRGNLPSLRLSPSPVAGSVSATPARGILWRDHTGEVAAARRVWLVLADPAAGDFYPKLLDGMRPRIREKHFKGITILLYG